MLLWSPPSPPPRYSPYNYYDNFLLYCSCREGRVMTREEEEQRWEFIQTFLMSVLKGRQRRVLRWMMSFWSLSNPVIDLINTSQPSFCVMDIMCGYILR